MMKYETRTINAAGWQSRLAPIPEDMERCLFCGDPYVPDYSDREDPLESCVECHHDFRVYSGDLSQPIFGGDIMARVVAGENIYGFASFLVIHERQLAEVEWRNTDLDWPKIAVCESCKQLTVVREQDTGAPMPDGSNYHTYQCCDLCAGGEDLVKYRREKAEGKVG